jgi:hypothetical protein
VLAADRTDVGRHASIPQERLEQAGRLDVRLDGVGRPVGVSAAAEPERRIELLTYALRGRSAAALF